MKKLMSLILLLAISPVACNKEAAVVAQKSTESQAPLLKSDQWQGTEDQVDPQIGQIKSLDE